MKQTYENGINSDNFSSDYMSFHKSDTTYFTLRAEDKVTQVFQCTLHVYCHLEIYITVQ
jgi:hypothetical protein